MSHVIDFITGFESLIDEYQTQRKPVSPEAIYTNTTLKLNGITPSSVGGLENFITEGASKVWKALCDFFTWLKDVFTGRTKAKEDELLKAIHKQAQEFKVKAEQSNKELKEKLQESLRKSVEKHAKGMAELNAKIANSADKVGRIPVVIDAIDCSVVNISDTEEKVKPNSEITEKSNKNINEVKVKKYIPHKLDGKSEKIYEEMRKNYNEGYDATTKIISQTGIILGSIKTHSGGDVEKVRKITSNFMSVLIKARSASRQTFMDLTDCLSSKTGIEQISKLVLDTSAIYKTGVENSRKEIARVSNEAYELHKALGEIVKRTGKENTNLTRSILTLDTNISIIVRAVTDTHYEMVSGLAGLVHLAEKFTGEKNKTINSIEELGDFTMD